MRLSSYVTKQIFELLVGRYVALSFQNFQITIIKITITITLRLSNNTLCFTQHLSGVLTRNALVMRTQRHTGLLVLSATAAGSSAIERFPLDPSAPVSTRKGRFVTIRRARKHFTMGMSISTNSVAKSYTNSLIIDTQNHPVDICFYK